MRFRSGLMVGFATGYVMGSKAGRERYERIRSMAGRAWQSPTMQRMRIQATDAARTVGETVRSATGLGPTPVNDLTPDDLSVRLP